MNNRVKQEQSIMSGNLSAQTGKKYGWVVALAFSLGLTGPSAHAQNDMSVSEPGDTDVAVAVPQQMLLERVDIKERTIYLDGDAYFVPRMQASKRRSADSQERSRVDLNSIKPGMTVIVETDGTAPSEKNKPNIVKIELVR